MARDEARIFAAVWKDEHFLALPPTAQRLYFFLLSQSDLSYCGLLALRERKWARTAAGLTDADIMADLKVLASAEPKPFVVVDEETEEVFVRSLIRRDGIWKQPNLMKAAREAAKLVESPAIRSALVEELKRVPIEETDSWWARRVLRDFLEDFGEPAWFPCEDPSDKGQGKGSRKGSGKASSDPSQGKGVRGKGKNSPSVTPTGSSSSSSGKPDEAHDEQDHGDQDEPVREDVERVCVHLADRVEAHGSKRPSINQGWRDAARLLMDLDGRTERQIHNMIDWCQADEWWRSRVMAMPKLRKVYDSMRLQALEQHEKQKPRASPGFVPETGARAHTPSAEELEQTEIDI